MRRCATTREVPRQRGESLVAKSQCLVPRRQYERLSTSANKLRGAHIWFKGHGDLGWMCIIYQVGSIDRSFVVRFPDHQTRSKSPCNWPPSRPIRLLDAPPGPFNEKRSVEAPQTCNATMKILQADAGPPLLYSNLSAVLFSTFDPFSFLASFLPPWNSALVSPPCLAF